MPTYKVSPFDNKEYIVDNGTFTRHLMQNGYDYSQYLEEFELGPQTCPFCNERKAFTPKKKQFSQTCGSRKCTAKASSRAKQAFSESDWSAQAAKYRAAMSKKTIDEISQSASNRLDSLTKTLESRRQEIVNKRRQTCIIRYNDPTYNNPQAIADFYASLSPQQHADMTAARKSTNLEKYGVESWISVAPPEVWSKRRATLEQLGTVAPLSELSSWKAYTQECRLLTERTYRANKHKIDPDSKRGAEWELDHIIPIIVAYHNDIDPTTISSIGNLRLITKAENRRRPKSLTECEITFLLEQIHDANSQTEL